MAITTREMAIFLRLAGWRKSRSVTEQFNPYSAYNHNATWYKPDEDLDKAGLGMEDMTLQEAYEYEITGEYKQDV